MGDEYAGSRPATSDFVAKLRQSRARLEERNGKSTLTSRSSYASRNHDVDEEYGTRASSSYYDASRRRIRPRARSRLLPLDDFQGYPVRKVHKQNREEPFRADHDIMCCCIRISLESKWGPNRRMPTMYKIAFAAAVMIALLVLLVTLERISLIDVAHVASSNQQGGVFVEVIKRPQDRDTLAPRLPPTRPKPSTAIDKSIETFEKPSRKSRSVHTTDALFVHDLSAAVASSKAYKDLKHKFASRVELCNEWVANDVVGSKAVDATNVALLPFSADFFTARSIFPKSKEYIFFHTIKTGARTETDDDCAARQSECWSTALKKVKDVIQLLSKDHHVIDYASLAEGDFGALPAMIATIVAAGHTIEECAVYHPQGLVPGFKLLVRNSADSATSTVFLLSVESSRRYKALYSFLKPKAPFQTLILPGQYELHERNSAISTIVASASHLIVQDDGGIPYQMLIKGHFDVDMFGNYLGVGVVGSESNWKVRSSPRTKFYQRDLREAYRKARASVKPPPQLPLNLGARRTLAGVYSSKSKRYVFRRTREYVGQHLLVALKRP